MRKLLRVTVLAAVLPFLIAAGCRAEEAPKLPDGVDALPKELGLRMKELLKSAEKYRGLKSLHDVPSGSLKEDALRVKMKLAFEEELPPEKMRPLDSALKSFGLIPEKMDLSKYYPELLTSQVGGYYDPRRKYLVIVEREGGLLGKEAAKMLGGPDMVKRMEETVMVHELTHALQDQHFDLSKFCIEDPLSDAAAARVALVEGDATLTMYNFFAGMEMDQVPFIDSIIEAMTADPKELIAMSPDMPGAKEMENAPAWFRDGMMFSYMSGYVFCIKVKKAGGQALLDHAFSADPPRSSEQILHPDKWLGKRDDPVEITLPDMTADLAGWTKTAEGTLGELGIRIWLNERMNNISHASVAAAGWGGDRFAVYEKDGARTLCWVTDWDTEKDAAKFKAACAQAGADWLVKTDGARRVTLTHAALKSDALDALHKTLNTATASVPANKPIDIAAVRRTPAKALIATTPDAPAMTNDTPTRRAKDSIANALEATHPDSKAPDAAKDDVKITRGKDGEVDIDKILNDPNLKKKLKEMTDGGGLGLDGLDMGELLKNPLLKEMVKSMLDQKAPHGNMTADGRGYKNSALGIDMKMPESAKDWTLTDKAPMPMILLIAESPGGEQVQIAAQPMPLDMPIESMGPLMEMGFKIALQGYKKIKDGVIGEGASKGYEFQYTGEQAGVRVRLTSRFYLRAGKMLVVNASADATKWDAHEKVLNEILNGIKIGAPASAEEKTLKE